MKLIQNLGSDCRLMKLIGPGDVTAGSAIEKVLRRQPVQILPMDEFGVILESVNGKGASSWAKTIRKTLLELYSRSTSIWSGKEYADPSRSAAADPIYCPTLSILGMSTPTTFYAGLTEASLSDGFLARLTVMHVKKRPARQSVSGIEKTPPELVAAIQKSLDEMPIKGIAAATADNYGMQPVIQQVPWENEEAEKLWISVEERQYDLMDNHDGQDGIIGRTAEQTIKYATIRALSRDTANPAVTEADIHWGYAIVHRSIDCIENGVEQYMAGSPFEELCNTILRALKESKDGELAHSVILKKKGVSAYDQRMVKSAYDRLQELGEIYPPRPISGGLRISLKDRTK